MIAVVDYGAGNLYSICNALQAIGIGFQIACSPRDFEGAKGILLPGVGHFGPMARALSSSGIEDKVMEEVRRGVPLLGICLGMQALYERSEEATDAQGLNLIPGVVKRLPPNVRTPHIGWNEVNGEAYYFANSYYAPISEWTVGATEYGILFSAIVERENVTGMQFHPEKSGRAGLALLSRWCKEC